MHHRLTPRRHRLDRRRPHTRLAAPALGLGLACTVACLAPATAGAANGAPTINLAGSSLIITDQPPGPATVTASRRDPLTGRPVVIGQFSGQVDPYLPFTVNTTAPNATSPGGDCWQQGALATALTPDLRPGDLVTVSGAAGPLGGQPVSTSVTVPADAKPSSGPIPACADFAPFAQTAVTDAPSQLTGGPLTVGGRAQPQATGVTVAATDGTTTTPAVAATPAADGTWSATIPAADVASLADGPLSVTPVVAVPDVRTGGQAHIAAAPAIVHKQAAAAGGATNAGAAPAGAATQNAALAGAGAGAGSTGSTPASSVARRVNGLRTPAALSLRTARARGISASFVAPSGASTVQLQVLRGSKLLQTTTVAARPGARQTVALNSPALRRALSPGRYTLRVRAGASANQLGSPLLRSLVVR